MKLLKRFVHPSVKDFKKDIDFIRHSARAICLDGSDILLMYTGKFDDYSLPGGGIDDHENQIEGLKRELSEETGAQNIRDIKEFGLLEELRPAYRKELGNVHMYSYCYQCTVDRELGEPQLETYEINNGMKPVWINIHEAIHHNRKIFNGSGLKSVYLEREIYIQEQVSCKSLDSI